LVSALEPMARSLGIRIKHITKLTRLDEIYRRLEHSMDLSRC